MKFTLNQTHIHSILFFLTKDTIFTPFNYKLSIYDNNWLNFGVDTFQTLSFKKQETDIRKYALKSSIVSS